MIFLYIYLIGALINVLFVRHDWRKSGHKDEFGIEYVFIAGSWITMGICFYSELNDRRKG